MKRRAPTQKKRYDQENAQTLNQINSDEIEQVFQHWVNHHWTGTGRAPELTENREKDIRRGIHQYGLQRCLEAIEGIKFSEWHMGDNPAGKKYNSLEIILREEWRINKFIKQLKEAQKNGWVQ